jgi:hypothetical protein
MIAGNAYDQLSALLRDYLKPLGMLVDSGPLRVMRELTFGIVFTGSVQLTNAARLFSHTRNQLEAALERMSGHLSDPHWDHREWAAAVLAEQVGHVQADDLIPLDGTELAKPYAHKMQWVDTIRDASRVGDPLVNGYWCWGAYHWGVERGTLNPLMLRPYSPKQPHYLSENDLILRWMWTLREATAGRGIWLIDRAADRPEILSGLLRTQKRWIVRLREDRALIGPDGTIRSTGQWADWALAHQTPRGNAVTLPVRLPVDRVPQPQDHRSPSLHLVVPIYRFIRDGKPDRWALLTCGLIGQHVGPRQVRYDYALRWRAEDAKRFLGQIARVERFLTRSFLALERMLWCVTLAGGFLSLVQREEPYLTAELEEEILYRDRPFKIAGYRMARGMQSVCVRSGCTPLTVNA